MFPSVTPSCSPRVGRPEGDQGEVSGGFLLLSAIRRPSLGFPE
jgi:hypothetical protein